jgi:hypothetical protein
LRIAEEGWDPMCRYSYISGACANKHVESTECIGEDSCRFSHVSYDSAASGGGSQYDADTDKWLSLFCETHGRFLCDGGEDCSPVPVRPSNVAYRQRRIIDDDGSGKW